MVACHAQLAIESKYQICSADTQNERQALRPPRPQLQRKEVAS